MKIVCQRCHAAFEIDEQRIPATGLNLRCLQCQQPLRLEGDLPAPVKSPPSSRPPAVPPELVDLPAPKPAAPAATPYEPIEISDLPEPRPVRPAAAANQGPAASSGDLIDLTDFDRQAEEAAGPLELSEPPAPGGISFPAEASRSRSRSAGGTATAPPPVSPRNSAPGPALELPDLPAPKGPPELTDLPAPKGVGAQQARSTPPALELPNLPAPKGVGAQQARSTPPALELPDLPAPKGPPELTDLPAPKGPPELPNLPAPKGVGAQQARSTPPALELPNLPAPKGPLEQTDLPAPKGPPEQTDLPAPKGPSELTDLLAPKGPPAYQELPELPIPVDPPAASEPTEQPSLKEQQSVEIAVDDLPLPEMPAGGFVLGSGQLELSMDDQAGSLELEDIPLDSDRSARPTAPAAPPADLLAPKRSSAKKPAAELGGIIDVLAPKEAAADPDGEEVMSFEPPEVEEPIPDRQPTPEEADQASPTASSAQPAKKPRSRRQRLIWAGGGLAALIVLSGVTVGLLVPDYGFFAINLLSGDYARARQAKTQLASSRQALRWDTQAGYTQAADGLAQAVDHSATPDEARALLVQSLAAGLTRFGPNPDALAQAEQALGAIEAPDTVGPELAKARGLLTLAKGDSRGALEQLRAVSEAEPGDAMAALYLGWAQERAGQSALALTTYNRALAAAPDLAGALYALAQLQLRQGRRPQAEAALKRLLASKADHTGALLLRAQLLIETDPQQARKLLGRVLAQGKLAAKSELSQAQVDLGQLAHLEGNNDEARKRLQAAVQIYPKNVAAHVELARLLLAADQQEQVRQRLALARRLDPENLQVALLSAHNALAAGKPAEAQSYLQIAAKQAPEATELLFLRGQVAAAEDKLPVAAELFARVIEQQPTHFAAYRHLARVYQAQDKLTKAAALLKRALEKQGGKSPELRVALAEVLRANDPKLAQEQLERALELAPEMNQALFLLGSLLAEQNQLEQAKTRLLQLEAKDKSYPKLQLKLAQVRLAQGEAAAAVGHYEQALAAGPPTPALRQEAAVAYLRAGQPDKAYDQATRIMDENPASVQARALRAEARLQQELLDEALVEIQQALTRQRKAEYAVLLGRILQARGETAAAVAAYSDALKLGSTDVEVRLMRGILLVKSGTVKDGLDELRQVVKEQPELARAYLFIGDAYADLGQERQAVASYRTAVSKDPALAQARLRLGQHLFDARSFSQALTHVQAAITAAKEGEPWLADAHYLLANIALDLGKRPLAKQALEAFLRLAPAKSGLRRDAQKKLDRLDR